MNITMANSLLCTVKPHAITGQLLVGNFKHHIADMLLTFSWCLWLDTHLFVVLHRLMLACCQWW